MRRGACTAAMSVVAALLLPGDVGAHPEASAEACSVEWGSITEAAPGTSRAPLVGVRAGRHACFDRLVLDLGGPVPPGYDVRYTDGFTAIGSGRPTPAPGGAILTGTVASPGRDVDLDATVPWRAGDDILTGGDMGTAPFRTFRSVVYGGGFEGRSAVGLGVRARLPFRVVQLPGPGTGSRIVVDVAHRW